MSDHIAIHLPERGKYGLMFYANFQTPGSGFTTVSLNCFQIRVHVGIIFTSPQMEETDWFPCFQNRLMPPAMFELLQQHLLKYGDEADSSNILLIFDQISQLSPESALSQKMIWMLMLYLNKS